MLPINQIILGDALEELQGFPNDCIDFIMTSPPYADNRRDTYVGKSVQYYVEWFTPISLELKRVLTPAGSFILNIKERVVNGERHPYVLELLLTMKSQGWRWVDEYIWCKKNSYPGKWPNRFRDAWERCLHFTKQEKFKMYQERMRVPIGAWAKSRLSKLSVADKVRNESATKSGLGRNVSNWVDRDVVYPTNVLHFATESSNKGHSAVFPITLPQWFIKLFTDVGDIVLDPFIGSGTTAVAAKNLGRNYIGIEIMQAYHDLASRAVSK